VGNFDKKYVKEDAFDSYVEETNPSLLKKYEGHFQTFTFNPQTKHFANKDKIKNDDSEINVLL